MALGRGWRRCRAQSRRQAILRRRGRVGRGPWSARSAGLEMAARRGVPCRCQSPARAADEPGVREARERVRDRRSLGGDELTQQAMGERQRQRGSARLDATPAGREVPQQQHQPDLEPRLAEIARSTAEIGRAAARRAGSSAWEICGQGRARSANSASSSASRVGSAPATLERRRRGRRSLRLGGCSRSPAPSSSVTVRSAMRVSTAISPSSISSPGPSPTAGTTLSRSHSPPSASSDARGRELARGEPHPHVELLARGRRRGRAGRRTAAASRAGAAALARGHSDDRGVIASGHHSASLAPAAPSWPIALRGESTPRISVRADVSGHVMQPTIAAGVTRHYMAAAGHRPRW